MIVYIMLPMSVCLSARIYNAPVTERYHLFAVESAELSRNNNLGDYNKLRMSLVIYSEVSY